MSTAVAVDLKYPVLPGEEPEEHGLDYWLDYYSDVYSTPGEIRAAAESATEKAIQDRARAEAARFRTDWATPPGRLSGRLLTAGQVADLVERLRREALEIDGRVDLGPSDVAGQTVEISFPVEVRPILIRETLRLALGPELSGELDRLWGGVERMLSRVRVQGGELTERRVQLFFPAPGYALDQRRRLFMPADQAREVAQARTALDRVLDEARTQQDRERLEQLREMLRGMRALESLDQAQAAVQAAEQAAQAAREAAQAAEVAARQAEERAAADRARAEKLERELEARVEAARQEAAEAERARAEQEEATRREREEAQARARRDAEQIQIQAREIAEAERRAREAEKRAEEERRERRALEAEMARFQAAMGLPAPGAARESIPVARRRRSTRKK